MRKSTPGLSQDKTGSRVLDVLQPIQDTLIDSTEKGVAITDVGENKSTNQHIAGALIDNIANPGDAEQLVKCLTRSLGSSKVTPRFLAVFEIDGDAAET